MMTWHLGTSGAVGLYVKMLFSREEREATVRQPNGSFVFGLQSQNKNRDRNPSRPPLVPRDGTATQLMSCGPRTVSLYESQAGLKR